MVLTLENVVAVVKAFLLFHFEASLSKRKKKVSVMRRLFGSLEEDVSSRLSG